MAEEAVAEVRQLNETNQYLTFKLDRETFALAIDKVREVLDFTSVTKVPKTPDYMSGVINLRGSVVPVMDLRLKFGMPKTEKTVNTCIIISEVDMAGETMVMGALADSVQEVLDMEEQYMEPPPRIGAKLNTDFIKGMGKHGDDFIITLDIDQLFTSRDMAVVDGMVSEPLAASA